MWSCVTDAPPIHPILPPGIGQSAVIVRRYLTQVGLLIAGLATRESTRDASESGGNVSGPKGYGYTVVSAAELQRREDVAREGRCEQLAATLAGLLRELRRHGVTDVRMESVPTTRTHESLISWEAALNKALPAARVRVEQAAAVALMRVLNAANESVDVSRLSLGNRGDTARRAPAKSGAPKHQQFQDELEDVTRALGRLRDCATRDELSARVRDLLTAADPAQARGDLLTVKSETVAALRSQEFADLAAQRVLDIGHLNSPAADGLRARAAVAASQVDVTEIGTAVAALLEADRRERDSEFVEAALAEVLAELGFSVDEEFQLTEPVRHVMVADHADHRGYSLRVQLNRADPVLYTRVVANGASSAEADAAAEDATCVKVRALADGLQEYGVATELKSERLPGERPVERRETTVTTRRTARRTTRKRQAQQQRRLAT